ncbi:MAG: hypothetical protein O7G86_08230 [Gammaproteobacteria bacterium]|nr:hypothetical protein [Gammaproteobacteria bacterium]
MTKRYNALRSTLILFVMAAGCLLGCAVPVRSEVAEPYVIHAEIENDGCIVELYVNDIPVRRATADGQSFSSFPVNQFLISGDNELAILVQPGPTPQAARSSPVQAEPCAVTSRLVKYPEGVFPSDPSGQLLIEIAWQREDGNQFPARREAVVSLGGMFGRWKWQDADVLTESDLGDPQLQRFVRDLQEAFASNRWQHIAELSQIRYVEGAAAYVGRDAARVSAMFVKSMERQSSGSDWNVGPQPPLGLRLCANGRMIQLISDDWLPLLRTEDLEYGEPFTLPVLVSRIEGKYLIVR